MSRLIAFGCSYTYGVALPDCPSWFEDPPSKLAWPSILAGHMGRECVNKSRGGSGNLEILWNILQFDYQADDIVIVMWSHFERENTFEPDGIKRFDFHEDVKGPAGERNAHWLSVHSEHDHFTRVWLHLHHANVFLQSKNLQYYNVFHANYEMEKLTSKPSFLHFNNIIDLDFTTIDVGSDNSHPGINSHNKFASNLFSLIKENFVINI